MALRKGKIKKAKEKKGHERAVDAGSDEKKKTERAADAKGSENMDSGADEIKSDSGKSDSTQTELEKITAERDEYLDRFQRATADFDNFQKRMRREVEETRKYAAQPFALELLGVVDHFELALESAAKTMGADFLQGFTMIKEQILALMEKHGVTPIEAVNKPFDPNFHDALLEVVDEGLPDKTVVDELQKGYMIHDRLLRPTRVRVSRVPAPEAEMSGKEGGETSGGDKDEESGDEKTNQEISSESRNKETKE